MVSRATTPDCCSRSGCRGRAALPDHGLRGDPEVPEHELRRRWRRRVSCQLAPFGCAGGHGGRGRRRCRVGRAATAASGQRTTQARQHPVSHPDRLDVDPVAAVEHPQPHRVPGIGAGADRRCPRSSGSRIWSAVQPEQGGALRAVLAHAQAVAPAAAAEHDVAGCGRGRDRRAAGGAGTRPPRPGSPGRPAVTSDRTRPTGTSRWRSRRIGASRGGAVGHGAGSVRDGWGWWDRHHDRRSRCGRVPVAGQSRASRTSRAPASR